MEKILFYAGPGLIGLCLILPFGAIAFYFFRRGRRHSSRFARGVGWTFASIVVLGTLALAYSYTPVLNAQREAAIAQAGRRVDNIAKGLEKYTELHDGKLPPAESWIADLIDEVGVSRECFSLPVPIVNGRTTPLGDYECSRDLGRVTEAKDRILVWTRRPVDVSADSEYRVTQGRFVIYSDCSSGFLSESAFAKAVEK